MYVKIEIMGKGCSYTSCCVLSVTEEDRGFLERVILENGYTIKVIPSQEDENDENW